MPLLRMLVLATAALLLSARPAAATEADWVKGAYRDVLKRSPTSQELGSAVGFLRAFPNQQQLAKMGLALRLVGSDEWVDLLVGADPFKPGLAQALNGWNLGTQSSGYYRCRFQNWGWSDETIIADMIGSTDDDTCGGFTRFGSSYQAYANRAAMQNPALAACSQVCAVIPSIQTVIDQIYQDLLGRHASTEELDLTGTDAEQVQATLDTILSSGILLSTPQSQEYRERLVRSAFLRFLRRLPSELPGTAPDGSLSELQYFAALIHGIGNSNETIYAYLLSLPEYETAVPQTATAFAVVAGVQPADVLIAAPALETFGSPPQLIGQVISPLFLDGIVTTSSAAVTSLSAEVQLKDQELAEQQVALAEQQVSLSALQVTIAEQQRTITALAVDVFGGAVTREGAAAMIGVSTAKITEAAAAVCPPGGDCADHSIVRARTVLVLAQAALDSNNFEEAERYARAAYRSAELAIQKGT